MNQTRRSFNANNLWWSNLSERDLGKKKSFEKIWVLVACINIEGIPVEWNIADKNYVYAQIKYLII